MKKLWPWLERAMRECDTDNDVETVGEEPWE